MNHLLERGLDLEDPTIPRAPLVPNFRMDRDTIPCPPPSACDDEDEDEVL